MRAMWRHRIGVPASALVICEVAAMLVISVGPPALAAQIPAAVRCSDLRSVAAAAGREAARGRADPRVSDIVSSAGELAGRAVRLDTATREIVLNLPTESFIGTRTGDGLVYTTYSERDGSAVHVVDLASGCDTVAVAPAQIVRSAILDPAGDALYIHSVTKDGRRDNGVARYEVATGDTVEVVPALEPSDDVGPTFTTELRWSIDGAALAVQSCGLWMCRTRVLDVASGGLASYDAAGQGALIALTRTHLVTYGSCGGLPCEVLSLDLATTDVSVLAGSAWGVAVADTGSGNAWLAIQTPAGILEVDQ